MNTYLIKSLSVGAIKELKPNPEEKFSIRKSIQFIIYFISEPIKKDTENST